MPAVSISARFEPDVLKAYTKNEATMYLSLKNVEGSKAYWCECEISVKAPLSLAHDKDLNIGRMRVGILAPGAAKEKQMKLYTNSNNFPDEYTLGITAYVYDEDGAIAERVEQSCSIKCEG
jgi:hypothetical protein